MPSAAQSAPTCLGPYIFAAERVIRSTPSDETFTESVVAAWDASVWSQIGRSSPASSLLMRSSATARAISRSGWIAPISPFARLTEMKPVAGVMASAMAEGSTMPSAPTVTTVCG